MVLFIHRYDYQGLSEDSSEIGKTDLIIAKHRNGEIGDVPLTFRASEVRFIDNADAMIAQSFVPVSSIMNEDAFDMPDSLRPSSDSEFDNREF